MKTQKTRKKKLRNTPDYGAPLLLGYTQKLLLYELYTNALTSSKF